ncbi:MAG: bifunctional proline dehydrogenase/L-glutamate gamma-semialdehyde dehydrogenase, partial [Rhizobiaceae bacterium]|nr:bifunctional proline dehydrogenase/L-glutamate gamma-semialdehyde dehydrogenase [Rhizobiaceae bacterium]
LVLGVDASSLLAQTIQALAAGNAVVAVAPGAQAALQSLTGKGLPLAAMNGTLAASELEKVAVDVVACATDEASLRSYRQALSRQTGPIVPLITELIYPAAYCHEHAVCVDTTAAGGNASLLATA